MDLNIHPEISTTVVNKPSKGLLNIFNSRKRNIPKNQLDSFFSKEEQAIFEASPEMSAGYLFKNTVLISIHIHFFKDQYTFYIKNNRQSVYTTHKHLNPNFEKFVDCSASLKVKAFLSY